MASSAALGILLQQGIGDTIRVSLAADPVGGLQAAYDQLANLQKLGPVGQIFGMIPGLANTGAVILTLLGLDVPASYEPGVVELA